LNGAASLPVCHDQQTISEPNRVVGTEPQPEIDIRGYARLSKRAACGGTNGRTIQQRRRVQVLSRTVHRASKRWATIGRVFVHIINDDRFSALPDFVADDTFYLEFISGLQTKS
jgi:hypothetical protein